MHLLSLVGSNWIAQHGIFFSFFFLVGWCLVGALLLLWGLHRVWNNVCGSFYGSDNSHLNAGPISALKQWSDVISSALSVCTFPLCSLRHFHFIHITEAGAFWILNCHRFCRSRAEISVNDPTVCLAFEYLLIYQLRILQPTNETELPHTNMTFARFLTLLKRHLKKKFPILNTRAWMKSHLPLLPWSNICQSFGLLKENIAHWVRLWKQLSLLGSKDYEESTLALSHLKLFVALEFTHACACSHANLFILLSAGTQISWSLQELQISEI